MWLFNVYKMDFFSEIASPCVNDYIFILKNVSMLQLNSETFLKKYVKKEWAAQGWRVAAPQSHLTKVSNFVSAYQNTPRIAM